MKLNYHPDTDSLYIDLSENASVESCEISEGVVLDYDERGNLVGIDIDNASTKVDLQKLVISKLPSLVETIAGGDVGGHTYAHVSCRASARSSMLAPDQKEVASEPRDVRGKRSEAWR